MPLKCSASGASPSVQRVQVLRGGDLQVVVAGDRHRHRGRSGERRNDDVELCPDEAAGGHRPALRRPEQAREPLPRGVVVGPPGRLDHQLDGERDHVHLTPAGLRHLQVEHQHRRGRVAQRAGADHLRTQAPVPPARVARRQR